MRTLATARLVSPAERYAQALATARRAEELGFHAVAVGSGMPGVYFHEAFGHDLQSFSLPTVLPHEQQLEMLERMASDVIPVVRKEAPSTLWTEQDPSGGRPAFAGARTTDEAAVIDASAGITVIATP